MINTDVSQPAATAAVGQPAAPALAPENAAASFPSKALLTYDANKKSVGVAYLLWFFLGGFGAHRFYLGRTGSAVAILLLMVVGVVLTYFVIVPLSLGPLVWLLVGLFLIPGMVRQYNNNLIQMIS